MKRHASHELDPPGRHGAHLEEQSAVPPAPDVGRAIRALAIPDGQLDELEAELRGAEQQIEIAKWIEIAAVRTVRGDRQVRFAAEHLRAAHRVVYRLPEEPGEGKAEELVADKVQETHD